MSQEAAKLSKLAFAAVADDDLPRALELFTQVAAAPDATEDDVATALKNKGVTLGLGGEREAAIACFDDVIARFAGAPSVAMQLAVFKSLYNKALLLDELGRMEEAFRTLDQLLAISRRVTDASLQAMVADTLLQKAIWIDRYGKDAAKAMTAYDVLIARFGASPEPAVRSAVAHGWVMKGLALHVSRQQGALGCLDKATRLLADASDDSALLLAARAIRAQAMILNEQGKTQEAEECCDPARLERHFGAANGRLVGNFIEAERNLAALAAFTNRAGG